MIPAVIKRCAGIDVGKKFLAVCVMTGAASEPAKVETHARWLAHLLRHGMIRPSFIPPRAIRELRDFTRRRKLMIGLAAEERNRVQKVLEDANVKIGDVLSNVFGLFGGRAGRRRGQAWRSGA